MKINSNFRSLRFFDYSSITVFTEKNQLKFLRYRLPMTRRVIYRFFAIEREDEGSWKIITKRIYLRVRVERKKKRGARVLRDDSTCLARLSPRDPRILQNHGGQLCKRLFGASVPAGSTGLNRNRVVQPTPSDRKLVRFRIETVPETRSPSRLPASLNIN